MLRNKPWILALLALLALGGLTFVVVTTSPPTTTSTANPTSSPSTTLPVGPTTTTTPSTSIPGPRVTLPPPTTTTTPSTPTTTLPRTPTTTQPRSTPTTTVPRVDPLTIATTALPSAVASEAYSFTLSGSGGTLPYIWSVANLPAGLSFDSASGLISGAATAPGNHLLSLTLYDAASTSTSTDLTLIVTPAPLVIAPVSLPVATEGSSWAFTPSASGGTPPYVWSVSGLPAGLSFDPDTGLISGTPLTVGESSITLSVSDGTRQASTTAELSVVPPPISLDLTTVPIPHPGLGAPYTLDLNDFLSGGQAPYTWFGFGLPPGLSLNSSTGVVSGQASGSGSFIFSVSVGDGFSTDQTTLELEVSPARLCEDNTSIPDLECLALSALADSSNLEVVAEEWATLPNPCDWPGVTCADGHVRALIFQPSILFGSKVLELTLPPELRHLTHLNTLAISHQTVSGALPAELGELSELRVFEVGFSGLSGQIPDSLGQLSALELLGLSGNDLSGTIPTSLAGLTSLRVLSLGVNNLSGPVPDIFENLIDLSTLFLHDNNLSGELPTSLFSGPLLLGSLGLDGNDCLFTDDDDFAAWLDSKDSGWNAACPHIEDLSDLPTLGEDFATTLTASSGTAPYEWELISGPPGLSLTSDGQASGFVRTAGPFKFTVRVTDSAGFSDTHSFSPVVDSAPGCGANIDEAGNRWIRDLECLALSKLAHSSNLAKDFGWANDTNPCIWKGVTCLGSSVAGLYLDASGGFPHSSLSLELPPEISHLFDLQVLHAWNQTFTAPLPSEIGQLGRLTYVDLRGSSLPGQIPDSLGNATNLTYLDLAGTGLSGPLPASLGNLTRLQYLQLSSNDLSGQIPESWQKMTSLGYLYLYDNDLQGHIPDIFSDMDLYALHLRNNSFDGSLPASLASLSNLSNLSLSGNGCLHTDDTDLAAKIASFDPNWANGCPVIGELSPSFMVGTETSVTLSASSGSAPYSWELTEGPDWLSLDPDTGLLSGTPMMVGSFSFAVEVVDAQGYTATASFEVEVGPALGCAANTSISDLECLALSKIAANSNLADEFGWADDLTQPCVWQGVSCEGSGVVDITLSADTGFGTLDVSLALPAEIAYLSNLRSLVVTNQFFTEPLPSEIGLLSSLTHLDLHSSGLPGEIPASVGNLANLTYLNLYINFLTGPIPASLGNLSNLEFLSLTTNRLDGPVPTSLANLTSLTHLDLSDNALEGEIPDIFSDLNNLEVLRLRYNFFDGPLPGSLASLGNLEELNLYGNGCFTAEDNLADWVELLDPDWEDGCPKIDDLPLSTFIGKDFSRTLTVSGGRWPYTWSLLDGPGWLSLDPTTGELFGFVSEVGTFPLTVEVSGTRGYTDTRTFNLTVHNVERCKNNTQIPDLECVALDAMVVPFGFAQLPWHSTTSPCDWQGVFCDLDSDGRGNVTRVVVGPSTFFSDGDVLLYLPPEIRYLSHLQELTVDSQTILTTLPPEIGQLSALKTLFIYDSALTGKIPSEVGNLSNLEVLVLGVNSLSGTLPASLNQLTNLQALSVESNSFTGSLPALPNLTGLLLLSVADNQLSGTIPDMFSSAMDELIVLDFSSNQLSGVLPDSLLSLPKLSVLRLTSNGCFTTDNLDLQDRLSFIAPDWQDGCG